MLIKKHEYNNVIIILIYTGFFYRMKSEDNEKKYTNCIHAATAGPKPVEIMQDENVIENIATTEWSLPKCEIPEAPPLPQLNDYPGHLIDELECSLDVKNA